MEAKIYVGTYSQYNNGSLFGAWIDLTQYSTKEEFYEACKELHKGEEDPEYMFQDMEGILSDMPEDWISESHVSDLVFEFLEHFKDDSERGEAFLNWQSHAGYNGDLDYLIRKFEESYEGEYENETAFAEHLIEEMGWYDILKQSGINSFYFDVDAFRRDLFMGDFYFTDGVVYRNI